MRNFMKGFFVILVLSGCIGERELTPDELQLITQLQTELTTTNKDIEDAKSEYEKYTGGLIKTLIALKLELFEINKALIEQRIHAIESGTPITVSIAAYEPDLVRAAELEQEIANLKDEIKLAREDAARYSGGLVLALKMSEIATQEQTLATLKLHLLSAKYGLRLPSPTEPVNENSNEPSSGENLTIETQTEAESSLKNIPVADGPFGLEQGLSRADVELMIGENLRLMNGSHNSYLSTHVPEPHKAFDNYVLVISETTGLCMVRGIGKNITTSSHGIQLKSNFEDLDKVLSKLYGPSEKTDWLLPGSIWKQPEDWMMGLVKEERFLFAQWPGAEQDLKYNIESIALAAKALNSGAGYLILEYSFSNYDTCKQEAENESNDAL